MQQEDMPRWSPVGRAAARFALRQEGSGSGESTSDGQGSGRPRCPWIWGLLLSIQAVIWVSPSGEQR